MLGITVVKKAAERVKQQRAAIEKNLSDRLGPDDRKTKLKAEVTRLEQTVFEKEKKIAATGEQIETLTGQLRERESELKALEEKDDAAVYTRRDEAKHDRDAKAAAYRDAMKTLRADFSSPSLYVPFFGSQLARAEERLSKLRVEGIIPQAELPLLKKLLNPAINKQQVCICGETRIDVGTRAHDRLAKLVEQSQDFEEGANRLDKIREDLLDLFKIHMSHDQTWAANFRKRVEDVKAAKEDLGIAQSNLDDAVREVALYEAKATQEQIRLLRDEVKGILEQLTTAENSQRVAEAELNGGLDCFHRDHGKGLRSELSGAQRILQSFYDTVKDAKHLSYAIKAGAKVIDALEATIRRIQQDQVLAVSDRMNYLFLTITNNGAEVIEDDSGNISVTSKVGIREVASRKGNFELCAETASGDSKPLAILNGASRQALTVSFMVALLENSDAPIPLVADSLFHPLSGNVKYRLAKHLLAPKVQKIIFFTHDDVQREPLRKLLMQRAARTYTVSNSAKPRDLAEAPERNQSIAMVCTCGPDEFCDTCELAVIDGESPTQSLALNPSAKRVL